MSTLRQTLCLWSILCINSIYSVTYIVDSWGNISLPFRTGQCQHIFPVEHFAWYECDEEVEFVKEIFEKSLCDEINDGTEDNYWEVNSTKLDVTTNCGSDTDTDSDSETIANVTIQTICDLEAPGARDLYLATNYCFKLSDLFYAKLSCDSHEFTTKLYPSTDTECNGEPQYTRTFDILTCNTWLFSNETDGFGFDIRAAMLTCDESGASALFNGMSVFVLLSIIWNVC